MQYLCLGKGIEVLHSSCKFSGLLGGLYVAQVARSVAVAAEPARLLLALIAEPQLGTGHAVAATAPAAPVAPLKELPALTRSTEQLYAVLRAYHSFSLTAEHLLYVGKT